jgi:hypothetical protein
MLTFIVISLVLEAELSDFPLDRPAGYIVKMYWPYFKVRFKIRFYDIVAVPASDYSAELPPEQD